MLIATYRVDETDSSNRLITFVAELERLAHPVHLRLDRFTRGEVRELVGAIRVRLWRN